MLNKTKDTTDPLFDITLSAIKESTFFTSKPTKVSTNMVVACLLLDSFYEAKSKKLYLHTALGSGYTSPRLGIFGSHLTHAWPEDETQLIRRFTDSTPLDFSQVAFDASSNKYEALNVGIGAFLHEVGHAHKLGIHKKTILNSKIPFELFFLFNFKDHTPTGIMDRDWWLNRFFLSIEKNGILLKFLFSHFKLKKNA